MTKVASPFAINTSGTIKDGKFTPKISPIGGIIEKKTVSGKKIT